MGLNGNQDTEERNSYLLFPSGPTKTPVVRQSTLYFLKSSTEHPFFWGGGGAGGKELKIPTNWIYVYINTGHRTGKDHFLFQSQRKAMPKTVQITIQLHSFHMLARLCSKSFKLGFSSTWTENIQIYKLDLEQAGEPEIKLPTSVGSQRSQDNPPKKSISASLTRLKPLTVWISTN